MKLYDLYLYSPKIIQELLLGIYGTVRRKKRYGDEFTNLKNLYKEIYYMDEKGVDSYQLDQLKNIIKYSKENSKYYNKKIKISEEDIKSIEDIKKLPILKKREYIEKFDEICINDNNLNYFNTSGTSGTPTKTAIKSEDWTKEYALIWAHREICGINMDDKLVSFIGRKIIKANEKNKFWRYNFSDKQLMFSIYHMNEKNMFKYVEKFNDYKCDYITGYPSAINRFAKFIIDKKLTIHSPKAIFTSSENLYEYQRENIEKAFKCKIYDYYGNAERSGVITQCSHGKYHVNIQAGILEVIDNRFIWTSFINTGSPLIRYEIGDIGELNNSKTKCTCGSSFPIVDLINGRDRDILFTKDGKSIPSLGTLFKNDNNIIEAQVIQKKIGYIDVLVVLKPGVDDNRIKITKKNIHDEFTRIAGDGLNININIVNEIERGKNGKFKAIVCEIEDRKH